MTTILQLIISIFIMYLMYKCCEKFEFKVTWFIYTCLNLMSYVLFNGFSNFFLALIIYGIINLISVLFYYKIYEHSGYSFWKFFLLAILIQFIMFMIFTFSFAFVSALVGDYGILAR